MTQYTWHSAQQVPAGLRITQVHGIAFKEDKIFLRIDGGVYKTTGGTPEGDETIEETLKREFMEEANIELSDLHYLGYQTVDDGDGTPPYAQVRMIAKVSKILANRPDPDNGKLYERTFVAPAEAIKLLNYGQLGNDLINDACTLAEKVGILTHQKIR